jgi:hypothetical protein
MDVALSVNTGVDDDLRIDFAEPLSDGGATVSHYRVELDPASTTDYRDPTTTFTSPITTVFDCPIAPQLAVYTVETRTSKHAFEGNANGTITGGSFALTLQRGGNTLKTDPIPWNAVAQAADEPRDVVLGDSQVYCTNDGGENAAYCPASRMKSSGSMESKLEALESLGKGVTVTRRTLDGGSYVWSITFLDDGNDFILQETDVDLEGSMIGDVVTTAAREGAIFPPCTSTAAAGSLIVPSTGGLVTGQLYYGRVFAYNQLGYGPPQVSLSPAKPMVAPGPPTGVTLEVFDATSLKVIFSPPASDGGDTIDAYLVEVASNALFTSDYKNASVVMLSAGAPFFRLVQGLTNGLDYYVRVRAHNSQGFGLPAASSPTYAHAMAEPFPPAAATLVSTSDTMVTIGWDEPVSTGGDPISHYLVEWDVSSTFNSLSANPDKGQFMVDGSHRSATIQYLATYKTYYVRVSARNAAGLGQPRLPVPPSASPELHVPGRVVSLAATTGINTGDINIAWDAPRVPAHGTPCSGSSTSPGECPTPLGGTETAANGGAPVDSYKVAWSVDPLFSATEFDAGAAEIPTTSYTVYNLTAGNRYFVRVTSRNIMGYGAACSKTGITCGDGTLASVVVV